jgi:hypothetical protein
MSRLNFMFLSKFSASPLPGWLRGQVSNPDMDIIFSGREVRLHLASLLSTMRSLSPRLPYDFLSCSICRRPTSGNPWDEFCRIFCKSNNKYRRVSVCVCFCVRMFSLQTVYMFRHYGSKIKRTAGGGQNNENTKKLGNNFFFFWLH